MTSQIHDSAFLPLDDEEKKTMESLEKNTWEPVSNDKKQQLLHDMTESINFHSKKTNPISIRLQYPVLAKLKLQAKNAGLPYQSIISLLAKQYTEGKITLKI